jgi:hypothetical protein
MQTILYDIITNNNIGEKRNGRYLIDGKSPILPENIKELIIIENIPPIITETQYLSESWLVDIEKLEYVQYFVIIDKTIEEIKNDELNNIVGIQNTITALTKILSDNGIKIYTGDSTWHYPLFSKRIVAPIQLVLQQASFEVWFRLNGLPIVRENSVLYCYCNTILPQHQEIANALSGIIYIEDNPNL